MMGKVERQTKKGQKVGINKTLHVQNKVINYEIQSEIMLYDRVNAYMLFVSIAGLVHFLFIRSKIYLLIKVLFKK